MATINHFSDLKIWQEARTLNQMVFVAILQKDEIRDFALKDQINRSAGSVMDNISEGFGRGGNKEFVQFLGFSTGSLAEVESQLYRSLDRKYISQKEFDTFRNVISKLTRMILSFSNYLKKSDYKGVKYKFEEPEIIYGNNSNEQ